MKTSRFIPILLAAIATIAFAQNAKTKPELTLESYVVRTELRDGKNVEVFEKAEGVQPGTIMEYRVKAVNQTEKAVSNLVIDLPIPRTTAYLENTATVISNANLLASWDFKRNFGPTPLKRKVTRDGKTIEEVVPAGEYTNLRWIMRAPLASGQTLEFKARVRVR